MNVRAMPRAGATTLIALPFAGGAASAFTPLARHLKDTVRFLPLDPPGHGQRIREPLLESIEALARDALEQVRPVLESEPWALLGHSMGALVAHRLAVLARTAGLPAPERLFLAACSPPGRIRLPAALLEADSAAFWDTVNRLHGLPEGFLDHPELTNLFEPILRADFRAVAAYRPTSLPELDTPVTFLLGREDPIIPADRDTWRACTSGPITRNVFPGGHFFLLHEAEAVARCLSDGCRCPVA